MTDSHYGQADAILGQMADDQMLAKAQAHAVLAVADALGRLAEPTPDAAADRLEAAVSGHGSAMEMIDDEIDRLLAEPGAPLPSYSLVTTWNSGWRAALGELRRRLREGDDPDGDPDVLIRRMRGR